MIRFEKRYRFSELKINIKNIERVLGYKAGGLEPEFSKMILDVIKEASSFCDVRAEYRIFEELFFNDAGHSLTIDKLTFGIDKIIYGQLKRAGSVAVFLCTAGEEISRKSQVAIRDGDVLTGYLYDLAGSEIVEAAADLMQDELGRRMSDLGLKITNRYSPGYCGWNVSEQHKLFSLMQDNFCKIRLTDSALMKPEKSVSGFIGIGAGVRNNSYTCKLCSMKDCIYRNHKEQVSDK